MLDNNLSLLHIVLCIEEGKSYGPTLLRAKQSPEKDSIMGNLALYKVLAKPNGDSGRS